MNGDRHARVSCRSYRQAVSSVIDDERVPLDGAALRQHHASCAPCRAFLVNATRLSPRLRIGVAEPVPDLTAAIVSAVSSPDVARRRARTAQRRLLLAFVGAVQIALAAPVVLAAGPPAGHVAREVAIFELALGIGFLVVAHRPSRAPGLLPMSITVTVLALVVSLADVRAGATSLLAESAHLSEAIGTALLLSLCRRPTRMTRQPRATSLANL